MFGIENYLGFIAAGLILNLTPGADSVYIITRSVAQGKKAGMYSVLGISSGGLIHTVFASLGLSVILAESPLAFTVVRYLGVGYLVYLGIKMIADQGSGKSPDTVAFGQPDLGKIYRQGMITNLLNPKVALFFLAFLPQFIEPSQTHGALPFLLLGGTFMTTGTLWCLFLAFSTSMATKSLRNNQRVEKTMKKISGAIFIGLGLKLLLTKSA